MRIAETRKNFMGIIPAIRRIPRIFPRDSRLIDPFVSLVAHSLIPFAPLPSSYICIKIKYFFDVSRWTRSHRGHFAIL